VPEVKQEPVVEVAPEPVVVEAALEPETAPETTASVEETPADSLAGPPIRLTPKQDPEPEPEPPPTVEAPDEAPSETVVASERDMTWHYVTLGIAGVALLQSLSNANQFNALATKNQELADSYASSSSAATKSEYQSNQSKMKSYKSQVQLWDTITLLALGVEAYLCSVSLRTPWRAGFPRVCLHSPPLKLHVGSI
jgi:hypothetical protein